MSWVPAERVLEVVKAQRQVLAGEQARAAQFAGFHATERAKVDAERAQAVHDLGDAVLPSLEAKVIARAAETVGLLGLPAEDLPAKVEARRAWLAARVGEVERDPRYVQRELLLHPRTGSLPRAIAEATELRAPASEVVSTCDDHPRFERLLETGFGTPEFSAPWWRYSYWEDRSAASAIVALFPGKTTFAEVRAEYEGAKSTVAVFDADIARHRAELADVEALVREHAAAVDEHQHLDARALAHTRGRIVEHLLTSDASLVSQRLGRAPALRLLFLRASGLAAKLAYLDGVERVHVGEIAKDIEDRRVKLEGVEQRTRRRWAPMPADKFAKLAVDRRPAYERRWQRVGKVYESVRLYDRWDRGRYYDDLLWWDLMTRGRYDGSYLPDVTEFHRRHPGYRFEPDTRALALSAADMRRRAEEEAEDEEAAEDARAAAAAIAADADDDGGPLAGRVDAS